MYATCEQAVCIEMLLQQVVQTAHCRQNAFMMTGDGVEAQTLIRTPAEPAMLECS